VTGADFSGFGLGDRLFKQQAPVLALDVIRRTAFTEVPAGVTRAETGQAA